MADLSLYKVDLDTPQPDGRRGESPRSAFTKYNDALDALRGVVEHIGNTPPPNPLPYMQWIDTSVDPAILRRRSADNTTWLEIGPALRVLGTAAALDVPEGQQSFGTASALDVPQGQQSFGTASAAGDASEEAPGIAAIATQDEVNATDSQTDSKFVTPKKLWGWVKQATENAIGMAKVATQEQMEAGEDDGAIVTPKKLRWGFSWLFSTSGYIVFPKWLGGLIIQWRQGSTGTGDTRIHHLIAYPNSCFAVVALTNYEVSGNDFICLHTTNIFPDGYDIRPRSPNGAGGFLIRNNVPFVSISVGY